MPDLLPAANNIAAQGNPVNANPLQMIQGVAGTLGQIAQIRAIQANVAQTQQQIAKQATDNLAADIASVPINPKNPNDPEVLNERMRRAMAGIQSGRYGPMGQTIVSQYAGQGGFTDQVAKELAVQTGQESEMQAQGVPNIQYQNVGPALVPTAVNPVLGTTGVASGGALATGPSGGELDTPAYSYYDPQRQQMIQVTKRQAYQAAQQRGAGQPGAQPGAPLGSIAGGGIPSGPALGEQAAEETYKKGQALAALDIVNQMPIAKQGKAAIENMRDQVGEFAPGPEAPLWHTISSIAAQFGYDIGPFNKNLGVNADAANNEFNKMMVFTMGQVGNMAGLSKTDMQTAMAQMGTPHDTMAPVGLKRVMGSVEGLYDYALAQGNAWINYSQKHPGVPEAAFQQQFNAAWDPRVFQYPYLDKRGQELMLSGMTAAQRKTFDARLDDARKRGWLGALGQ